MLLKEDTSKLLLTVIGCGDAFSSGGNAQACFHVQTSGGAFLIDCGAGALAGLKQQQLPLSDIDTIILSHFHGDHYGGLPYLLLDAATQKRQDRLTIMSPPGGEEKIRALLDLLYPGTDVLEKLNLVFIVYQAEEIHLHDAFAVHAFPVRHKATSSPHGLRIRVGKKIIGYSGDTGWTDQLVAIAQDTDLFICECCFYDTEVEGHLSYRKLSAKQHLLQTKQFLLTHFDEEMLARRGDVALPCARDGLQVKI